jgi:hypothetical protein
MRSDFFRAGSVSITILSLLFIVANMTGNQEKKMTVSRQVPTVTCL